MAMTIRFANKFNQVLNLVDSSSPSFSIMFEVAILGSCNKPIPFKALLRYQPWAMCPLSHGRHRSFCRPPRRSKRHRHTRRRGAKWQSGTVSTPEPWVLTSDSATTKNPKQIPCRKAISNDFRRI